MSSMSRAFVLPVLLLLGQAGKAQWEQVSTGIGNDKTVLALGQFNGYLFAGTENLGVFRSADGQNWTAVNNGVASNARVDAFVANGGAFFLGTAGSGVYRSTDDGLNWQASSSGLSSTIVTCLTVHDGNLIAGTQGISGLFRGGVWVSTNNGASWSQINSGLPNPATIYAIASTGTALFAGTTAGPYVSTNSGASWTLSTTGMGTNRWILGLAAVGNTIYAAMDADGIYMSTNNGTTWTQTYLQRRVTTIASHNGDLFAGSVPPEAISYSLNGGTTWNSMQGNLPTTWDWQFLAYNGFLYTGKTLNGVWRRSLSGITDIDEVNDGTPLSFELQQNYPNPFNPSTTFTFYIQHFTFVILKVYDLLGREVATLVNEVKQPGSYEMTWDASGFASGVYLYRLTAGSFSVVKKLILLR
jgi:hypothetical protein